VQENRAKKKGNQIKNMRIAKKMRSSSAIREEKQKGINKWTFCKYEIISIRCDIFCNSIISKYNISI